jgi:hypothetical protein
VYIGYRELKRPESLPLASILAVVGNVWIRTLRKRAHLWRGAWLITHRRRATTFWDFGFLSISQSYTLPRSVTFCIVLCVKCLLLFCVALCAVLFERGVIFVWYVHFCVLCLIVVPLSPGKNSTSTFLFRLLCGLLMFFKTLLVFSTLCRFLSFKL